MTDNIVDICLCPVSNISKGIINFSLYINYEVDIAHDRNLERLLASIANYYVYVLIIGIEMPLIFKKLQQVRQI